MIGSDPDGFYGRAAWEQSTIAATYFASMRDPAKRDGVAAIRSRFDP
jgi:hypothetical protein